MNSHHNFFPQGERELYTLIDLHVHSNCSDGSNTPKELVEILKQSGITTFALTDHDTIEGCIELSKNPPEGFIPAVELTCKAGDIKCHILGYNIDLVNQNLLNLIEKGKKLRRQKLETRIKYLKNIHNIELTQEEKDWLYSRKSVVKTHVANILVNRKLAPDNVSAMKKYLDDCKCPNTRFDGIEGIETIKKAGGIPVWAHPLGGEGEKHISEEEFIPKLKKMIEYGIEGLECYYSRYNFDEINLLIKHAEAHNLFITGGSDFHGTNKLGITPAKLNTENKTVNHEKLTILPQIIHE